jgi:hypothetical protein
MGQLAIHFNACLGETRLLEHMQDSMTPTSLLLCHVLTIQVQAGAQQPVAGVQPSA